MPQPASMQTREQPVRVPIGPVALEGTLTIPPSAQGIVLFAHGSGSSRHSPRNRFVAQELQRSGLATLLIDLLTPGEEAVDLQTRQYRFDISLLAHRLVGAIDWLALSQETQDLRIGCFGASTGAGAALVAAAARPDEVVAVVSRGGRPDLAGADLARVRAATLLIVGGLDQQVIVLNQAAFDQLHADKELVIVPGATHLFEEPGALEAVARLASGWLLRYLNRTETSGG